MATSEILNIIEAPILDESIEKFEFHEYEPVAGTTLNNAGEIRINIEHQDLFTQPSEAFLLFEGRLTKADSTAYANADAVALTNNGLMFLFNQTSYQLSNQDIETVFHRGQATTMLGLLKYPEDFSNAQGLNQLWQKDTTTGAVIADNAGFKVRQACIIQKPTTKGTFSFIVPLRHIVGELTWSPCTPSGIKPHAYFIVPQGLFFHKNHVNRKKVGIQSVYQPFV